MTEGMDVDGEAVEVPRAEEGEDTASSVSPRLHFLLRSLDRPGGAAVDLVSELEGMVVQAHGELAAVEDRRQLRLQPVPPAR